MTERMRFITLHQEGLYSMSELCQRFGISRQTGYKWLGRFEETGLEGLKEQSRAPHSSPHRTGEVVEAALLAARQAHPHWGPQKLRDYLQPRRPDLELPAPSTIGALLKRHGLIPAQARRRRLRHPGSAPLQTATPNQVWCVDFKGEFPTRDGVDCYPLTVTDAHTRYLLACQARPSTAQAGVFPVFQRLFAEHGLPEAIRSDNGIPFASTALCGLSQLSVWWLKLGITHQRIEPGRPEQNGRHERMHRTLKAETARPPASDHRRQQERFDAFVWEYNEERPHQALGGKTPAALWTPSARRLPLRVREHEYPGHYLVRKISQAGNFRFWSRPVFLSRTLTGEQIGLEETGDGIWSVYFRDYLLARFDERVYRIVG
jgi:transposase InsO family protein